MWVTGKLHYINFGLWLFQFSLWQSHQLHILQRSFACHLPSMYPLYLHLCHQLSQYHHHIIQSQILSQLKYTSVRVRKHVVKFQVKIT